MFIEFATSKGRICINVNKVLFFGESKKGTSVILEDGTVIDLDEPYETIALRFQRHTVGVSYPNILKE